MQTALGYVRVSSDEQAESGVGLDAQRQRIRAYCELKELQLAAIFDDPGVSGGKPVGSRPAGSRLLEKSTDHAPGSGRCQARSRTGSPMSQSRFGCPNWAPARAPSKVRAFFHAHSRAWE
jgi:hypothetical protein